MDPHFAKMWHKLFIIAVLWVSFVTLQSPRPEDDSDTVALLEDGKPAEGDRKKTVIDLVLVQNISNYPIELNVYCEAGTKNLNISFKETVRSFTVNSEEEGKRLRLDWKPNQTKSDPFMLICKTDLSEAYDQVISPAVYPNRNYAPELLSKTINKDEELRIKFKFFNTSDINTVKWRFHTETSWRNTDLTNNKEFIGIKSDTLQEGIYHFNNGTGGMVSGVLLLTKRKCPKEFYKHGKGCKGKCPQCLYGGVCHDLNGMCVCSPGRYGNNCELSCDDNLIGQNCTIKLKGTEGIQICLPKPYGCSCAPGRTGSKCDQECQESRWGVDCAFNCNHCLNRKCNKVNGTCEGEKEPCAGESLGLPRLKDPPNISNISTSRSYFRRNISWKKNYFGEVPSGAELIGYKLIIKRQGEQELVLDTVKNTASILSPELKIGDYEVEVLVKVQLKDKTPCAENGTYRYPTIQKANFTVNCPEQVIQPTSLMCNHSSERELTLSWSNHQCNENKTLIYKVRLLDNSSVITLNHTSTKWKFTDLMPGQAYKLWINICDPSGNNCSESKTAECYTHPSAPEIEGLPEVLETSGSTTKIKLPKVLHPPACQYVVVVASKDELDDQTVQRKSLDVVINYSKEHSEGCGEGASHNDFNQGTSNRSVDDIEAYIAGEVRLQSVTDNEFEIGDGHDNNKPLDDDGKNYKVTVVTETASGPYNNYTVSKPINIKESIAGGFSGILYGLLTFVVIILLFVWRNRVKKARNHQITQDEGNAQRSPEGQMPMDNLQTDAPRVDGQ